MLEKELDRIRSIHQQTPISQDVYDTWYQSPVTQRLYDFIELSVIDSYQQYFPTESVESIAILAMVRQGAAEMAENILDWSPDGVRNPNDEVEDNED